MDYMGSYSDHIWGISPKLGQIGGLLGTLDIYHWYKRIVVVLVKCLGRFKV